MADVFMLTDAPIRVNTRNEWLHGDDLINPKVAKLFAHSVQVAADGSYAVHVGRDRQSIAVDDTPYSVVSMVMEANTGSEQRGLERVRLSLSDGTQEELNPATLMQSADNALYCRIERQNYAVPCRFTPQQYHALALHADDSASGYGLQVAGQRYPLKPYDRRPLPLPLPLAGN